MVEYSVNETAQLKTAELFVIIWLIILEFVYFVNCSFWL